MLPRNQIIVFILLAVLTVAVAVIPDIVADDLKTWCLDHLGPNYAKYLIGIFVAGTLVLLLTSSDMRKGLFAGKAKGTMAAAKNSWSPAAQQCLEVAKEKIRTAQPEAAIQALAGLKNDRLDQELSLLSARLATYRREARMDVIDHKESKLNRISKGLLELITDLDKQLAEGKAENTQLRDAFRQRYKDRLTQKLASRQPVNLRRFASKEGTSEIVAATFIPYNSEEIREEIGTTFQQAHGRLLIVGQPGAGKTTLLLQLADRLFELEADALPVVLNLATWKSSFGTLETWIETVMAAELSTNKAGAKAALRQANLIVLLDGLDELKEDAAIDSCLAAIATYGEVAGRKFVITCRIEEYKRVKEDARVHLQIEIGPLQGAQLEAELGRMGREQPEALPLLQAIQRDPLLRQAVETPFYFNTLQLLFAGKLPVFTTTDITSRQQEIKQLFVQKALQRTAHKAYTAADSERWLAFLAANMQARNLVTFELRDLQYDWWPRWSRWEEWVSLFIFGLVFGLDLGLVLGLVGILGLVGGLVGALVGILGLVFPLVFALVLALVLALEVGMPTFYTRDVVQWSIKAYMAAVKANFINWLVGGLVFGLVGGLGDGLGDGLVLGLVLGLGGGLGGGLIDMIQNKYSDFIQIKTPYQRFYASMKVFHFSILQHGHLRYRLYKKGALPLDLVDFLTEMVARDLLESDGATWRFRHRMIQDYFAALWEGVDEGEE